MRIGLTLLKYHWPGSSTNFSSQLATIARTADECGFYSLWVMDHVLQLGRQFGDVHGPEDAPMLEGYSTIAYLAALTQRIKLGLLVTCNLFRQPGLLVKTVSTIDVLSGGRAYLGLGAGWFEREAVSLGLPFPPALSERFGRLEETLQIAHQMWSGDTRPFTGKYYQLAEPINNPMPISQPHPPILIGGGGEKKTLRLVAQYADACNLVIGSPLDLEEFGVMRGGYRDGLKGIPHKLDILREHCEAVNRPYDAIEKTAVTYLKIASGVMGANEVVDICHELAEVGISHVIFEIINGHEITPLEIIGRDVLPQVANLVPVLN